MNATAITEPEKTVTAIITTADGTQYNLGRLDRKFNPRLWFYKYITYPRLKRQFDRQQKEKQI